MGNRSKREHSEEVDSGPSIRSYFMRRRAAGIYLKDKYGHGSDAVTADAITLRSASGSTTRVYRKSEAAAHRPEAWKA
jgi:hypothetical protein